MAANPLAMLDDLEARKRVQRHPLRDREPSMLRREDMEGLLEWATLNKASDLVLQEGEPPIAILDERTVRLTGRELYDHEVTDLVGVIFKSRDVAERVRGGRDIPDRYQFSRRRGEVFQYRVQATAVLASDGISTALEVVFRPIPGVPPTAADLGWSQDVVDNVLCEQGLVLIAGITGSGKSTSMAGFCRTALETRPERIITVENPIEYNLQAVPNRVGSVAQSQIGSMLTDGWAQGTRAAMRRSPRRFILGEIRDPDTIQQAYTIATTGHAVMGTVHAESVSSIVGRMVTELKGVDPWVWSQHLIRQSRVWIYQKLLPKLPTGLVLAREVLIIDSDARRQMLDSTLTKYPGVVMELLKQKKARLVDDIDRLYLAGLISAETRETARHEYMGDLESGSVTLGFEPLMMSESEAVKPSDDDVAAARELVKAWDPTTISNKGEAPHACA